MSFKCEKCHHTIPHGQPSQRVVTERRTISHPHRHKANRDGSDDKGGLGEQIVKEIIVCTPCGSNH